MGGPGSENPARLQSEIVLCPHSPRGHTHPMLPVPAHLHPGDQILLQDPPKLREQTLPSSPAPLPAAPGTLKGCATP